jgi:hypothetical protein
MEPGLRFAIDPTSGEVNSKLGACASEPGFDGADRSLDRLCDFFVGKMLLMEQDEDDPVFGPESGDRAFQLSGEVIGVSYGGSGIDAVECGVDVCDGRASRPPGQHGAATVGGNPQEPWSDWTARVETTDRAQRSDECLLHNVFGILTLV